MTTITRSRVVDDDEDRGSDVTIDKLVLDVVSRKRRSLDTRIDAAIVSGEIVQSMSEAPSLTLDVLDPDDELLLSGMFDYRIDVELDGIPFRLVTVERGDDGILTLTFEHRLVAYMREHTRARKFSRGSFTRAEAAKILMGEIKKAGPIRFVSLSLHRKQPIESVKDVPARKARDTRRESGFSDGTDVKVGGRSLRRSQLKVADELLATAASHNAPPKATLALIEAGIVESGLRNLNYGDRDSLGVLQVRVSTSHSAAKSRDVAWCAAKFLEDGFWGRGGAISLAKRNPSMSAGEVAQNVQGSGVPSAYGNVKDDAQAVIDAWGGGGGSFGAGGTYWKRYEFRRGQPGTPPTKENTWEALTRWASEVRWRFFVVGARTVYFSNDNDLMKSRARYTIDRDSEGVVSFTFSLEVGRRSVARKGRRDPKPSTATLHARIDRWAAPPGTVIEVKGFGPADDRWLVDSVRRPIFEAEGEISLRQPQKQLPEPRSEQGTRGAAEGSAEAAGGEGTNAVYAAAVAISEKGYPYVWGGGHARAGHPDGGTGRDPGIGYDCSGYTAACLDAAGMLPGHRVMVSGGFASSWGEPGEGEHMTVWANAQHVWIEFVTRKARADTSPYGSGPSGARVRPMPRGKAGFTPRHWKGGAQTKGQPLGQAVSTHRSGG